MALTITETAILQERRASALQRLATRYGRFYTVAPDGITGGHIVRNVNIPGRFDIVDASGQCSCKRYQLWDICRHVAIVEGGGRS